MSKSHRILFIEDSQSDVELVTRILMRSGFQFESTRVETQEELRRALETQEWDLVLSDNNLPTLNASEALGVVQHLNPDLPLIVISGAIGEEKAVDLMRQGARDFISKSNLNRLVPAVSRELVESERSKRLRVVEQQLSEQEQVFKMMIEAVRDYAIFMMDSEGRIMTWNVGARRLLGYSEEEAIGKSGDLFLPETERNSGVFQQILNRVRQEGRVEEDRWLIRKNGGRFWSSGSFTALLTPEGEVRGYTRILRDQTEKKMVLEQVEEARRRAEMANRAKTQFLANMSHEIRTPLGILLGFAELLLDPRHSADEKEHFAKTLLKNGQQLSRILNDVLDVSKVEANKLETEKMDVVLSELMADVLAMMRLQAEEKGLELVITSEGPVPRKIRTDPTRLRQILINLIGNALKFTEMGLVEVKVRSVSSPTTHSSMILEFEVKDTGRGIAYENVSKLFHPFVQGDSSTARKYGGTGLGLYLSRRLVQALGGDLTLRETSENRGSTFVFTIDAGPFETDVTFYTEKAQAQKQPEHDLKGIHVLVVDDSPDNRLLVRRMLEQAGAQVQEAENGNQALEKATSEWVDMVLMDIQMPVLDGYEAFRKLREKGFQKPIVALTAHALHSEREHCFSLGFDEHLSKPVDRTHLLETVLKFGQKKGTLIRPHLVSLREVDGGST